MERLSKGTVITFSLLGAVVTGGVVALLSYLIKRHKKLRFITVNIKQ